MHLEGSCHCRKVKFTVESAEPVPFMRCYCSICRKTAGTGGYAINLGAVTHSMKVTGKRHLRIYRARLPNDGGTGTHLSTARRYFCAQCGSALWLWDPTWPDLVHPHAGAIDTPLPRPPDNVHCLIDSKAPWVKIEGEPDDPRFDHYPSMSLAQWHESKGLHSLRSTSPDRRAGALRRTRSEHDQAGEMKKSTTSRVESASELIDARIEELGDWRGEMLARIRTLIKEADPEVVEEWKWRGTPVWSHDGLICTGETYKSVVKLTFAKGASLPDPSSLFNASLEGNTRRAIDLHEGEKVSEKALKALIRAAVKLNKSSRRGQSARSTHG